MKKGLYDMFPLNQRRNRTNLFLLLNCWGHVVLIAIVVCGRIYPFCALPAYIFYIYLKIVLFLFALYLSVFTHNIIKNHTDQAFFLLIYTFTTTQIFFSYFYTLHASMSSMNEKSEI